MHLHATLLGVTSVSERSLVRGLTLADTLASCVATSAEPVFGRAGFAQLSRGELGNAGQNLFVSTRGELKLINWFDLDRDGDPHHASQRRNPGALHACAISSNFAPAAPAPARPSRQSNCVDLNSEKAVEPLIYTNEH
jgi:hypothetical protein